MASSDDQIVTEPPAAGNDADTLVGSLERQRRTVFWKCAGLDAAGMRTTVGASSITLGGLLKHLALEVMVLWEGSVSRSRAVLLEAIADGGLDQPGSVSLPDAGRPAFAGSSST
jgi:Protein of unknown function (DUF664)